MLDHSSSIFLIQSLTLLTHLIAPHPQLRHCSLSHSLITLYLHLFSFISPSLSYFLLGDSSIIHAFRVDLLTTSLSTSAVWVVVLHLCVSPHPPLPPTPPSWLDMGHSQPREELLWVQFFHIPNISQDKHQHRGSVRSWPKLPTLNLNTFVLTAKKCPN